MILEAVIFLGIYFLIIIALIRKCNNNVSCKTWIVIFVITLAISVVIRVIASFTHLEDGDLLYVIYSNRWPVLMDIIVSLIIFFLSKKKYSISKAYFLSCVFMFGPVFIVNATFMYQYSIMLIFFMGLLMLIALTQLRNKRNILDKSLEFFLVLFHVLAFHLSKTDLFQMSLIEYRFGTFSGMNVHDLFRVLFPDTNWDFSNNLIFRSILIMVIAACYWERKNKSRTIYLAGALLISLETVFQCNSFDAEPILIALLLLLAYIFEHDCRLLVVSVIMGASSYINAMIYMSDDYFLYIAPITKGFGYWMYLLNCLIFFVTSGMLIYFAWDIYIREHIVTCSDFTAKYRTKNNATTTRREKMIPDYRMNLKVLDYVMMFGVMMAYGIVAFYNVGSTVAPQTSWSSEIKNEQIVFDLGEESEFNMSMFSYFDGEMRGSIRAELSNDGENWSHPLYTQNSEKNYFSWQWFAPGNEYGEVLYEEPDNHSIEKNNVEQSPVWNMPTEYNKYPLQTARYIRLTFEEKGITLFEVAFHDKSQDLISVKSVTGNNNKNAEFYPNLLDEQITAQEVPGYMNSMYFDEVYHARTAFEHLHGYTTYEWTHPPLGKVIMMLGIKIWGMTPFGWRFMGTLIGVLMLPALYLLVKQLTKKTSLSMIAMCLFALDSMHYTLTRIATVDSYSVFWIIIMYMLMIRYMQMNWETVSFRRTLIPLGLCGIVMGVGWATKWIVIYASVGLAILFFWTLVCRITSVAEEQKKKTWKKVMVTCLFCIVFFVIIPMVIYYFSYFWHLRGEGLNSFREMFTTDSLRRVIELQRKMLDYHSNLEDTHFFRSPWYEWPLILRPIWFFDGEKYALPGMASSISCMGNPIVWWFGILAIIIIAFRICWNKPAVKNEKIVLIGFISQYFPWMLITRTTFIYHYFASVPFIIVALVLVLDLIHKKSLMAYRIVTAVLLLLALAFFVMFYPVESGYSVSSQYIEHLRWFNWVF